MSETARVVFISFSFNSVRRRYVVYLMTTFQGFGELTHGASMFLAYASCEWFVCVDQFLLIRQILLVNSQQKLDSYA